ncbi:MAG TPA: hypothetical protein VKB93_02905 [Thermoanaerobaculia bacterium]|nr:hypothetical protein [Thermoanaerobaculia bacterium]
MISERLRKVVESGLSIVVGTADSDRMPSCCRAIAVTTNDDFETVTVYVPVATRLETMANIATTRRVAVTCSEIPSHESTQIKGVTRSVRLAPQSEQSFLKERLDAFAGSLELIGLPRQIARSMSFWPAYAIDLSVEEVFDQTPGPKAGNSLT